MKNLILRLTPVGHDARDVYCKSDVIEVRPNHPSWKTVKTTLFRVQAKPVDKMFADHLISLYDNPHWRVVVEVIGAQAPGPPEAP